MDFTVTWTAAAFADFERIVTGIAAHSRAGAERIRAGITRNVGSLQHFPLIGPVYPRDRTGQTREIVFEKYRIFYRVQEEARVVEILCVWHGARKEPTHI